MSWRNTLIRYTRRYTLTALKLANFAFAIHFFAEYVAAIEHPSGPSMLPTISAEGELVLDNKLVCRLFPERLLRGDIVTFVSPLDPERVVCKRILGLPGDTICVDPTGEKAPSTEHVIVPAGHFWVGGDNAAWSRDSRDYGPVPIALMKGRLVAKTRSGPCEMPLYSGTHPHTFHRHLDTMTNRLLHRLLAASDAQRQIEIARVGSIL